MPFIALLFAIILIAAVENPQGFDAFMDGLIRGIVFIIEVGFWGGLAFVLFRIRGPLLDMLLSIVSGCARAVVGIVRAYYYLTPHPAKEMVSQAIASNAELDGKAFAEIMRSVPGGRIKQQVRREQGRKLAERARQHGELMRAEAERLKAKLEEETTFLDAQDELAQAANAHARAKARLKGLRKRIAKA